jgi:hypothetical protein
MRSASQVSDGRIKIRHPLWLELGKMEVISAGSQSIRDIESAGQYTLRWSISGLERGRNHIRLETQVGTRSIGVGMYGFFSSEA